MQPLRLLLVATVMVAVLALVAGAVEESDRRGDRTATAESSVATPPPAPSRVVEAKVPSAKPIEVQAGQTLRVTMTLESEDTVTIDALGFDETVAAGIPTAVLFTPYTPGRFAFKLQNSGKQIGELVVTPARPAPEGQEGSSPATTDRDAPGRDPEPADAASA